MIFSALALGAFCLFAIPTSAGEYPRDIVDELALSGVGNLKGYLEKNPLSNCTLASAPQRKEWSDLAISERQDYIKAVLCLQAAPTRFTAAVCPGCRSRYDDFTAVHIQDTPFIHATANFLGWHRYYLWAYETALRDECGYQGYQPYWNWDRYAHDPVNSPLFNGNDSSMGGNGAYAAYRGIPIPGASPPNNFLPQAQGGGCVTSGPFKDMEVRLGPSTMAVIDDGPKNPRDDWLGYNPRCLRRDVNKNLSIFTTANYTYDLIVNYNDIDSFQNKMQGQPTGNGLGVHISGHYTIGGDPGGDLYVGPAEPTFWFHHAMIDRVWWIWQMRDLNTRLSAISGTITFRNDPPSRNGTLEDVVDLGVLGPATTLGDLLTTMGGLGGKFCYTYHTS